MIVDVPASLVPSAVVLDDHLLASTFRLVGLLFVHRGRGLLQVRRSPDSSRQVTVTLG